MDHLLLEKFLLFRWGQVASSAQGIGLPAERSADAGFVVNRMIVANDVVDGGARDSARVGEAAQVRVRSNGPGA